MSKKCIKLIFKIWLCGSQKYWKILQDMGIPDHLTYLLPYIEIYMKVKKQQLELDTE